MRMRRALSVVVIVFYSGIASMFPWSAEAAGCRCDPVGVAIRASACQQVVSLIECKSSGQALSVATGGDVSCAYYTDDACVTKQSDHQMTPSGESPMFGAGAVNVNPTTGTIGPPPSYGGTTTTIEFPKARFQIPEINIKIPGLTGFQEPRPSDCPAGIQALGFSSCRAFPWLGQYIIAIYNFGIAIAAFLAVVMIMWGGFLYITSSGISSQAEKGKEAIKMAFLGLVIAFTSYILLATINPDLVKFDSLKVPDVAVTRTSVDIASVPGGIDNDEGSEGATAGSSSGGGVTSLQKSGSKGVYQTARTKPSLPRPSQPTCSDCVTLPSAQGAGGTYQGVKPASQQPGGQATDKAAPMMAASLQELITTINSNPGLRSTIGEWRVNEAWPPTVYHQSACHVRGCALDIALVDAATDERIGAMWQAIQQLSAQGKFTFALNHYWRPGDATPNHFHIEAY